MVFSVSPSVMIREVDATTVVPAIANPPAAIAGVFRWGPTNERTFITSEQELVQRFGKPHANTTWQNFETFFTTADYLSYANAIYVTRVESGANTASNATISGETVTSKFAAKYPGKLGNALEISYIITDNTAEPESVYNLSLFQTGEDFLGEIRVREPITVLDANNDPVVVNNPPLDFNSNSIIFAYTSDFEGSIVENDIIRIGNVSIGYQDMVVSSYTKSASFEMDGYPDTLFYRYTFVFKNNYTLSELNVSNLTFTKYWGSAAIVTSAPSRGSMHLVVRDKTGEITGTENAILEVYQNLSGEENSKLDDGSTNYYREVIENRSAWITTKKPGTNGEEDLVELDFSTSVSQYLPLAGGLDGLGESDPLLFGAIATGYDLYRDANEVDIAFILQGKALNANMANYIVQNIAERRKDCVAYVSPPKSLVVDPANPTEKMNNIINQFRANIQSSSYCFIDSGYKYRYDKYNDVYRWVPMNGDMAGLAARVDPWESPAGYKRGVVKNVVKLAFNPNKEQRDILYGKDINPVISQVGQGVLLFGDKTALGRPSAFDRINVRRLFITVEKAIATVSASFLFDFNDDFTQTQFKNLVDPFLRDIQGKRGIIDFRVVSDATVNTPDVIDRNIFRGNIFIKPSRSINFIELTFVATRTGVDFDEIVGQPL
jgi:hypothetical protein